MVLSEICQILHDKNSTIIGEGKNNFEKVRVCPKLAAVYNLIKLQAQIGISTPLSTKTPCERNKQRQSRVRLMVTAVKTSELLSSENFIHDWIIFFAKIAADSKLE